VPARPRAGRGGFGQVVAIATAIEESAGQALIALRSDPAAQAAVGPVEDAFVGAARTVGFVAAGFMGLGLAFSLLLPSLSAHPHSRAARGGRAAQGGRDAEVAETRRAAETREGGRAAQGGRDARGWPCRSPNRWTPR
jgi:hypothetical protein